MSVLELRNISFSYFSGKSVFNDISLNVEEGEIVLLVGGTGSGKSTLIRIINGLIPFFYPGRLLGDIIFNGKIINKMSPKDRVKLGIRTLLQFPESQLLGIDVRKILAKNLGNDFWYIVDLLEITNLLDKKVSELSGGEKQRIALAMIMGNNPRLLLLDEPLSQIDVQYARKIMKIILLFSKYGVPILIAEHRINELALIADKIVLIDNGRIMVGKPFEILDKNICNKARIEFPILFELAKKCGLRNFSLQAIRKATTTRVIVSQENKRNKNKLVERNEKTKVLSLENVWYWYKNKNFSLRNINLELYRGEFLAILGMNGSGKTTLLKLICGLIRPKMGRITLLNKQIKSMKDVVKYISYLPQNPDEILFSRTVYDELNFTPRLLKIDGNVPKKMAEKYGLIDLLNRNPLTLSGGEKFLVAFASIMTKDPKILILDETTRGLDCRAKQLLLRELRNFIMSGGSVIMATHDIDLLVKMPPDRIVVLYNGAIVMRGDGRNILLDERLYDYGLRLPLISEISNILFKRKVLNISEIIIGECNE